MKYSRIVYVAFFTVCLLASAPGTAVGQYQGIAVKKDKLLGVLRSRTLQTRDIVGVIKKNGVDFRVDPAIEGELQAAGARPEVIDAAKAHYRGGPATTVVSTSRPAVTNPGPGTAAPAKSGKPLDKAAIVSLLDAGVAEAQIVKNIQARGVSYYQSAKDQQDIRAAGGSPALVTLIAGSYAGGGDTAGPVSGDGKTGTNTSGSTQMGDDEDDGFGNVSGTVTAESLQKAVAKKTESFLPYQQLGMYHLYTMRNILEAERFYRESITRGGSGVFQVAHDHGANNFTIYCLGNLYIAADLIRFESHDNIHTFETSTANVEKAKMNSAFWASMNNIRGPFSLKLKTGDKDSKNYNFLPLSQNENESKMLLRLIGKN